MGQHEAAEAWCRLAMHRVFENAGDLNTAKIARYYRYALDNLR
jgi:hypothetical protein